MVKYWETKETRSNKKRRRKDIGVKIWEFSGKHRELSGNGRATEAKIAYKPVAFIYNIQLIARTLKMRLQNFLYCFIH